MGRDPALVFLAMLGLGVVVAALARLVLAWHRKK